MRRRLLGRKTLDLKISAVVTLLLLPAAGEAAPRQLDCKLATVESTADPNFTEVEARSIVVTVDQEANTIT